MAYRRITLQFDGVTPSERSALLSECRDALRELLPDERIAVRRADPSAQQGGTLLEILMEGFVIGLVHAGVHEGITSLREIIEWWRERRPRISHSSPDARMIIEAENGTSVVLASQHLDDAKLQEVLLVSNEPCAPEPGAPPT